MKIELTPSRLARGGAALLVAGGLTLSMAACGSQSPSAPATIEDYTPADGTQITTPELRVRNLVVVSRTPGSGFVTGGVVTQAEGGDTLRTIKASLMSAADQPTRPLAVDGGPLRVPRQELATISKDSQWEVRGEGLKAGGEVELTLVFLKGGTHTLRVPVVNGDIPTYRTVTPSPIRTVNVDQPGPKPLATQPTTR